MTDLRESVSESTEMEKLRIELELDKQNCNGKSFLGKNWCATNYEKILSNDVKAEEISNANAQRDSGLPDLDQPSISSLSSSCTAQRLHEEKDLIEDENNENCNELNESADIHTDLSLLDSNFTAQSIPNNLKNGTRFCRFMNNQTSSDIYLKNNSCSSGSTSTLPSSITTFNSLNSVNSANSVNFATSTSNGIKNHTINNKSINLRKINATPSDNNSQSFFFYKLFKKCKFLDFLLMPQTSVTNISKVNVGLGNITISGANSRVSHRLSFNSLDSGMVEEGVDYPT